MGAAAERRYRSRKKRKNKQGREIEYGEESGEKRKANHGEQWTEDV